MTHRWLGVAAALVVWLAPHTNHTGLRVPLFLVPVAIVVAVLGASVAIDALRPALVKGRGEDPGGGVAASAADALGRPLLSAGAQDLRGEFTIDEEAGVRRYREQ